MADGDSVAAGDRWAGFNLSAGRAAVSRLRRQLRQAAQYGHEAIGMVIDTAPETLDYAQAFGLLGALTAMVDDLARAGGLQETIQHYSDSAVELARRLAELHPDEPDYRQALAGNLLQRARLNAGTPRATEDAQAAVSAVASLAQEKALPSRVDEARSLAQQAAELLEASRAEFADEFSILSPFLGGSAARRPAAAGV